MKNLMRVCLNARQLSVKQKPIGCQTHWRGEYSITRTKTKRKEGKIKIKTVLPVACGPVDWFKSFPLDSRVLSGRDKDQLIDGVFHSVQKKQKPRSQSEKRRINFITWFNIHRRETLMNLLIHITDKTNHTIAIEPKLNNNVPSSFPSSILRI